MLPHKLASAGNAVVPVTRNRILIPLSTFSGSFAWT
jgi:hypothetical protein